MINGSFKTWLEMFIKRGLSSSERLDDVKKFIKMVWYCNTQFGDIRWCYAIVKHIMLLKDSVNVRWPWVT